MKENAGDKFSKRLGKDKRMQVVFFLCSMALIFLVDFVIQREIKQKVFDLVADDLSWMFQVDSAVCNEKELVLEGWAFELDGNSAEGKYDIVLCNIDTEKRYYPEMEYTIRDDVNGYFLCEYDYAQSGFVATIPLRKLDLDIGIYEILVRPVDTRQAFKTGIYYANGELMFANPDTFTPLNADGTELEQILKNGILRVYRPDFGMYVYQFDNKLYWIADENFAFEDDGSTYIQYQLWTTQTENLPQHRLDNEHYWDNIGFLFEEHEMKFDNANKYRVAVREIPQEYSITEIRTGYVTDNVWVWKQDFRIWHSFN